MYYESYIKRERISKEDFIKIKEDDVMFITNPGRMGDINGSIFIVKKDNKYKIYRLDEWVYRSNNFDEKKYISLGEEFKQFPKWEEAWKHSDEEFYKDKYKYIYMGFGNGLSVDNSIYEEFKTYLDDRVEEYLEGEKGGDEMLYVALYNSYELVILDMLDDIGSD